MKAIILVGGQGTRLRPLTLTTPKPLLPLVNRPLLDHVINLLSTHGLTDIILAVGYRSERFEEVYGDGSHLGVRITYVREDRPLDTGWAIKNVQHHLNPDEACVVFNGDILTDLPITDMIRWHRERGALCTIALTPVEDPSQYGVVDLDEEGRIVRFTEKPGREEATSNWINAGTYIMEPQALDYIPEVQLLDEIPPGRPYSVELGLFPTLLKEGKPLYGYRSGAYWMDIGTPEKYMQAHFDLLAGRLRHHLPPPGEELWPGVWAGEGTFVHSGARISGPVVLGRRCAVHGAAVITGPAVLGDQCEVGEEVQLERLVVWDNVVFEEGSSAAQCILGRNVRVGARSRVDGMSIVADGASIGAGCHITGAARIQPGQQWTDRQEG
jgi:mannose-1-phosphate guanylyltransferase